MSGLFWKFWTSPRDLEGSSTKEEHDESLSRAQEVDAAARRALRRRLLGLGPATSNGWSVDLLAAGAVSSGACWIVRVVLHRLGEDTL